MKQLVSLSLMLLLVCSTVQAQEASPTPSTQASASSPAHWQEHRHSLSLSAGYISGFWLLKQTIAWIPAAAGHSRDWKYYGNYGLAYHYQLRSFCRIGAKVLWEVDAYDTYESKAADAAKKGRTSNHTVSLMASVQFTYLNRPHVQLYSGADVGVGACFSSTNYEPGFSGTKSRAAWLPAVNITPLGVGFGNWRVYGYVESNVGFDTFVKAGIGVHI